MSYTHTFDILFLKDHLEGLEILFFPKSHVAKFIFEHYELSFEHKFPPWPDQDSDVLTPAKFLSDDYI